MMTALQTARATGLGRYLHIPDPSQCGDRSIIMGYNTENGLNAPYIAVSSSRWNEWHHSAGIHHAHAEAILIQDLC